VIDHAAVLEYSWMSPPSIPGGEVLDVDVANGLGVRVANSRKSVSGGVSRSHFGVALDFGRVPLPIRRRR
jgi:hypothetical protein